MKLYATMWDCGDEECGCTQPQIIEVGINPNAPHWGEVQRDILETGPFYSQASIEEIREQHQWLLEAARRHGVENLADVERVYGPQPTP